MSERRSARGLGEVYDISNPAVVKFGERVNYGQQMQELVDPFNFLDEVSRRIEAGAYPVFFSNHNQHLNIGGFREVITHLSARPENLYVAVAHSLVNEGQDPKIVAFGKSMAPILANDAIHMIPVAREKDLEKLKKDSEEKAEVAARDTFHNLRHLSLTLKEDAGFIFFPEATTEGAVKVNGKRSGMIEVTDNLFEWVMSNAQRYGRELVFVPVGMVDTNRILEPRTSNAHVRPKLEILKDRVSHQLGIDMGPISKLAKVVVGQPFDMYDIWESGVGKLENGKFVFDDDSALNTYMMRQVAVLLRKEDRGFYK